MKEKKEEGVSRMRSVSPSLRIAPPLFFSLFCSISTEDAQAHCEKKDKTGGKDHSFFLKKKTTTLKPFFKERKKTGHL